MKQQGKEFDRSRCFMFFESYLESAEKFQKQFGTEIAFNYLVGIARYALYQEESKNELINALVSSLKNTIDSGQEKRSKGFSGENFEQTKVVAEYYRDHPKASQRAIADATGVGKTKVQKTLAKIKESGMEINEYILNVINPNLNPNSNSNSNSNINSETTTETSRESSKTELAVAQTDASLEEEKREQVISCFQKGMSYKKDNPEIQKHTGLNGKVIHSIIQEYYEELKENENKTCIPLANGIMSEYYIEDFNITKETLPNLYCQMVGKDSHYNFKKEFVDEWLLKEYGYKAG